MEYTTENVKTWLNDFVAGKLTRFLKSEPVPTEQNEPVRIIVGNSVASEVLNSSNDVFILFYAPWCGHCQKMKPDWEKLATKYKSVEGLTIAKIDATANDVEDPRFNVSGFPTIFYMSGEGENRTVKTYDGDRDYKAFSEYILKNNSKSIVEPAEPETPKEEEKKEDL